MYHYFIATRRGIKIDSRRGTTLIETIVAGVIMALLIYAALNFAGETSRVSIRGQANDELSGVISLYGGLIQSPTILRQSLKLAWDPAQPQYIAGLKNCLKGTGPCPTTAGAPADMPFALVDPQGKQWSSNTASTYFDGVDGFAAAADNAHKFEVKAILRAATNPKDFEIEVQVNPVDTSSKRVPTKPRIVRSSMITRRFFDMEKCFWPTTTVDGETACVAPVGKHLMGFDQAGNASLAPIEPTNVNCASPKIFAGFDPATGATECVTAPTTE